MHQHSCYRGPRRRSEREKGPEKIFEDIIAKKFSHMGKEIINQIKAWRNTLRHIVTKLTKIKDKVKILKAISEK